MILSTASAVLAVFLSAALRAAEGYCPTRPTGEPVSATAADLFSGRLDFKFVRITGTIMDVFRDENDSRFRFFIIFSGNETIYAPTRTINESDETLESLVGAEVSVCGVCDVTLDASSWRRQFRRNLYIWDFKDITVLTPAPADPFDVDELGNLMNVRPADVPRLGRRRVVGKVLATWANGFTLLSDSSGACARIEPKNAQAPRIGDFIEAVGMPESDIYRVNLTRAVWRPATPFPFVEQPVTNTTAETILTDRFGKPGIKPEFHGRTIRLTGFVRSLPQVGNARFYLQDGRHLVPVDTTAVPSFATRLAIGSQIAVTGICVTDVEAWRPGSVFPRAKGFFVVPQSERSLEILSRPPWWTPTKFLGVIGALVSLLVAVLIWNRSLRVLAERRGKTLLREQIGRVKNKLKVGERTRLAVELHDSIAQNLTGISFEIKAANNFARTDPQVSTQHLGIAARLLHSCRNELKNCIWELRSQALEATRMDEAIRQTLQPHIGSATLSVRFNVPRRRISDDMAHALLRIIRELASNAVRHGHATAVKVAGCLEGDRLDFSVVDNGSGFDPANRPGVNDGHFGLQGVHERVASEGGTMTIESRIGSGSRIAVSLTLRPPEEEEETNT